MPLFNTLLRPVVIASTFTFFALSTSGCGPLQDVRVEGRRRAAASRDVTLTLKVQGKSKQAKVNYRDAAGVEQERTVSLPWEISLQVKPGFSASMGVVGVGTKTELASHPITASLWADGQKRQEYQTDGKMDHLGLAWSVY